MQFPLVSVIITTYNRFDFLCRAIDSVLAQTYCNVEIVVVDDCSCDGTEKKITKYLDKVKYIRNEKNIGLPASRNIGIAACLGNYISFLDDDDVLLPQKIEKQMTIFTEKPDIDVVYCGSVKQYESISYEIAPTLRGVIYPEVLSVTPNAIHTLLIRKKCFDTIGVFDESLRHLEDFDFWIRLSKCCLFDFVSECLVVYNIHGDQMSTNYVTAITGRDIILHKYEKEFKENKKYYYKHLRRQASKSAIIDDYNSFYQYLWLALIVKPLYFGTYIHFICAIISHRLHKKLINKFGVKTVNGITTF